MQGANAPDEIFALLRLSGGELNPAGNAEQIVIERRGDAATMTRQGAGVQYISRPLSADEFRRLKTFIDSEKVDELGPVSAMAFDVFSLTEYVHLTRTTARRVYMRNFSFTSYSTYGKLREEFFRLIR
jgi:hypothetical protein